jgi:glycerophosphoryl diester phosphodiesterase
VIAHRGASGGHPENTLLAFEQAVAQGADALELDVRATADGIPVVMHDTTVDRTTNGRGPVAGLSLVEIRRLYAGAGELVPTLEEVLTRFGQTPLLIEIKNPRVGPAVVELIQRHGAEARVLLGSFHLAALRPARKAGLATAPSRIEVGAAWAASRLWLPGWPGAYRAFSVPEKDGMMRVVDARFLRLAARLRKPVHVWTVNDPGDAARLWNLGVCGIVTDYPRRMKEGSIVGFQC